MFTMFNGLWAYRQFVISSIKSELVSRFARSKLGGLWIVINPLSQVAIYALILSNVLAAKLPGIENKYAYAIYLMAGLLAWSLFNEIVNSCVNLFIAQGNLMKKMSFPRITLPVIVVGTCILNNFLLLASMMGIFLALGQGFSLVMLWLIPLMFVLVCLALGLGLILGILNVFIRDIGQIVPIVLQIWFWFTPIVYPESIIPEAYRHLLSFNPIYGIVSSYHQVLVYGEAPSLSLIIVPSVIGLGLVLLSLFLFRRASAEMVDVL